MIKEVREHKRRRLLVQFKNRRCDRVHLMHIKLGVRQQSKQVHYTNVIQPETLHDIRTRDNVCEQDHDIAYGSLCSIYRGLNVSSDASICLRQALIL